MLKTADFDYTLPEELIANTPPAIRGDSRLLSVQGRKLTDYKFSDLVDLVNPHDLIIFNDSKVIKARLLGNKPTGGKIEILIERILPTNEIIAHVRSNKTIPIGLIINLEGRLSVVVTEKIEGLFKLMPQTPIQWLNYLEDYGHVPLPPYIKREDTIEDNTRYQTVYAKNEGSVAAPTAGLHFTDELINKIKSKGANIAYVTLHVGSGTFKPVTASYINEHKMHSEMYSITNEVINLIHQCKSKGGSIIAVGTTSVRTLETVAANNYNQLFGETDIFITPGFKFRIVDKLVTNFHLPKSTLLMLVSAFAGIDNVKAAYTHAINNNYRFFSYGDACIFSHLQDINNGY